MENRRQRQTGFFPFHRRWFSAFSDGWSALEISPKLVLGLEYTDISRNPNLQNRLLGSLSYLLPITAGTTIPLTLVYANQGRYRGEVDKEFFDHLWLNYKFNRK